MTTAIKYRFWVLWLTIWIVFGCPQWASGTNTTDALRTQWHGYFKLDLAYDYAHSSHGNFIMYVRPYPQGQPTSTINLTARQTRLGLQVEKEHTSGQFEIDFYGGGPENKNLILLRKAYVDLTLGSFMIRAGQASDLISPLSPSTLNYTVGWGAGNIGYRRPQIQIASQLDQMFLGIAFARNISTDLNGDSVLDGEASCIPVIQARLAYPVTHSKHSLTLGASAHYGLMNSPGAPKEDYNTWSLTGDLKMQITPKLALLGEYYTGANTGAYFGAILNGDCVEDLKSHGGWANLQYQLSNRFTFSTGGGQDALTNTHNTSLAHGQNIRSKNTFLFGNVTYQIYSGVTTGLEISSWQTTYFNASLTNDSAPKNIRVQWSLQSNF